MDDTSCKDNCPFMKMGACSTEKECPNYVESWWQPTKEGAPKIVKDCVPKRLMLQLMSLQTRLEGVQAASEQNRNECHRMSGLFQALLDISQQVIDEKTNEVKKISN